MDSTSGAPGIRALASLLDGADILLMLGAAAALLVVAFTIVRQTRPRCVWMVVLAAALEVVALVGTHAIVPALMRHYEYAFEARVDLVYLVPPLISLATDLIQTTVVALLVVVLVRMARPAP